MYLEFLDFSLYSAWEDFESEATANNGMNSAEGDVVVLRVVGNNCRIFLTQSLLKSKGGDFLQECDTGVSLHIGVYLK